MADTSDRVAYEGLWEDIVRHGASFAGKRVRVLVLKNEATPSLTQIAQQWVEESVRLNPEPGPEIRGLRGELRRFLTEKYRNQGLKL